jgi:Polyketide cyclase / dehydrase and lipid transport
VGHRLFDFVVPVVLAALVATTCGLPSQALGSELGASSSILINAPPKVVWRAVHEERLHDPDLAYVKVLGRRGESSTLEEKFVSVPIIGSVICVLNEHELQYKRIDYRMLKSDKFKRMEGSWDLTPVAGGTQTLLKLSSYLDVGVPFSGLFIRSATQRKIERRVSAVKCVAEREQAQLAAEGRQEL